MFLLDKQKVQFNLHVEKTVLNPGDTICGVVTVNVLADVDITALRLRIQGKEKGWIRVSRRKRTVTYTQETVHFERFFTLFGFSKASGRKGGAMLAQGTYTYPFSVVLPANVPPSLYCTVNRGGAILAYTVVAYADIPNGLDAEVTQELTVLSCVPASQLQEARNMPLALEPSRALVHGCDFCGCFCCKHDGAYVDTEAAVAPRIVVNAPAGSLPCTSIGDGAAMGNYNNGGAAMLAAPQDPRAFTVRVTVRNNSQKDEIKKVQATLHQFIEVKAHGYSGTEMKHLSNCVALPPNGILMPGQSMTVDMTMKIPAGVRTCKGDSSSLPMPMVSTMILRVSTILEVTFPGTSAEGVMSRTNVVALAGNVDFSNCVPPIPCSYMNVTVMPEEPLFPY